MSLFTRFPASRFLVFGSLAIVVLSSPLRAQDLRKWMPNVGGKFVFWGSGVAADLHTVTPPLYSEQGWSDTITETILDINYFYDSIHPSVVRVSKNWSHGYQEVYYEFSATNDSLKLGHAFSVQTNDVDLFASQPGPFNGRYDFTNSTDSQLQFMGSPIQVLVTQRGSTTSEPSCAVLFSPNLHWFAELWGLGGLDTYYQTLYENYDRRLIAATTSSSLVSPYRLVSDSNSKVISVLVDNELLSIDLSAPSSSVIRCNLLDLLGRPVRAWSLDVSAGESEVSLNDADVPSGVYFLRVSAAGGEEMRKVVIVH